MKAGDCLNEKFNVTGMSCAACSAHVEKAVAGVAGVKAVSVNLLGNSMMAEYSDPATAAAIMAAVSHAGYGASQAASPTPARSEPPGNVMEQELLHMKKRLLFSVCFLLPLFYLAMGHMLGAPLPSFYLGTENALLYSLTQFLLTLPILYYNDKYYKVGFSALFRGAPNMDSLIAVGSSAAVLYGVIALFQIGYGLGHGDLARVNRYSMDLYFESAGMILTLITLGKYLETRSKGKTGTAIAKLIDLTPKTANVLRSGSELEVPVMDLVVGDLILVRPGGSVPVDGVITEGSSAVDESALTGESIPVDKTIGDRVISASLNKSGAFTMQATRVGDDTTLAQMIRLVDEAASSKAPIAKLADQVAGIFVPVVMVIAVVTAAAWLLTGHSAEMALTSGIAVLVISCPCALGLATPVAIMVGTGMGAENGILFKSAQALETLHTINTVVLDKTGTITKGTPSVTDVYPCSGVTAEELLCVAASLEQSSEHPLGAAIVAEAEKRNIPLCTVDGFLALHGKGVSGSIQGAHYLAGNRAMLEDAGINPEAERMVAETLAEGGKTPLFFAKDHVLQGIIAVADTIRDTSRDAIQGFRALGIEVVMLTGDNARTAAAVGRELNVSNVIAEVLPADKQQQIARLQKQGKRVAMVGDGINDAPALALADVGLAIGAGTDVAIESADVVLMKSDLRDAVTAVQLSRAVIRNIRQNLFWAFFYNAIGIPLAAGVFYPVLGWQLSPMFGAAAMSLSSVCVVSNALRLKLFTPKFGPAVSRPKSQQNKGVSVPMKKKMIIEGMMCNHCTGRVEKALFAVPGVTAVAMDLDGKSAAVTLSQDVSDADLTKAVLDAGYEVTSIS